MSKPRKRYSYTRLCVVCGASYPVGRSVKDFTTTCAGCDPRTAGRARALATLEVIWATEQEIDERGQRHHRHPIWGRRFR